MKFQPSFISLCLANVSSTGAPPPMLFFVTVRSCGHMKEAWDRVQKCSRLGWFVMPETMRSCCAEETCLFITLVWGIDLWEPSTLIIAQSDFFKKILKTEVVLKMGFRVLRMGKFFYIEGPGRFLEPALSLEPTGLTKSGNRPTLVLSLLRFSHLWWHAVSSQVGGQCLAGSRNN